MEPSPLAPGGRRAGATGCRGAATPATDTARAPGRCRHGEAARGLSAFEMNQVTSRRAQLARATRSARNGGPQPERARARGPGSLVGSLRRVKKERNTPPGVARGRTWWARPGCLENGWGKAGRAVDCVRATARVVRARLGGARYYYYRVSSRLCVRARMAVAVATPVLQGARVSSVRCAGQAGRQADRPFLRFEACSLVLHDRSVVSLEAVRRDWLARDFTFLSSSHAFFFSSVCPREIGPKSYGTCMFCIFFLLLYEHTCQKLVLLPRKDDNLYTCMTHTNARRELI